LDQEEEVQQNTASDSDQSVNWRQLALDHLIIHNRNWNEIANPGGLRIFVRGQGCYLTDLEGRTYFDAMSAIWLKNVGYGRKEIAEAVYDQMQKLTFHPHSQTTIPPIKLAAKIASITPGTLSKVFFVSGGSEAVETTVKMSKQYQQRLGFAKRYKVISRRGSYHGSTYATMSLGGTPAFNRGDFEPLLPGAVHVPHPWCHRCDYGLEYPDCNLQCAREVERTILFEGPDSVAAVIAEPVSVPAGVAVPPPEYWPMLRSICDKYGVLLIADEVICGFGRTGKMFGTENWNVVPDLMALAKGMSSGYLPIGACVAKSEIVAKFVGTRKDTFSHVFTFGGHPVACTAALVNIEIIEREGLVENAAALGKYLLAQLQRLYEHPIVGDIRGIGLMCAVDFVKDRKTKERFKPEDRLEDRLTEKFAEAGLFLLAWSNMTIIMPPLIVSKAEIDELVDKIDWCIREVERKF
jgi:adenosylmethionine-8-amino-7-oxononanoate aminotransferase